MKTLNVGMVALFGALVAGAAFVACGGSGGAAGSGCAVDKDCASGELCHPIAKFCVKACTSASDCPASEKTCATLTANGTTTGTFCQCADSSTCGTNSVCGKEDKVCENPCKSDADCSNSGRTCNTTSGQCVTKNSSLTCNPSNENLSATTGGPDVCAYGSYCPSTGAAVCTAVEVYTDPTLSAGAPAWNANSANVAPVITEISASSSPADKNCSSGDAGIIVVSYYSSTGFTTHSAFYTDPQTRHVSINVLGSGSSTPTGFGNFSASVLPPTPNDKFGKFTIARCGFLHATAALYITDESGNNSNTVHTTW